VAYGPGQAYPPYPGLPPVPVSSVPISGVPMSAGVNPSWLAANADRERTVGVLRAGFTEGRLSREELDDRVARAYAARTYSDLWALTADLPAGPYPYPVAFPAPQASPAVPPSADPVSSNWHSAAALIITALVIFTLAALVTAIATAHAQPMPLHSGPVQPFQQAQLAPFIKHLRA
jgi:Domain of unknown function (DUF1707)